jgi:hypothetical protein
MGLGLFGLWFLKPERSKGNDNRHAWASDLPKGPGGDTREWIRQIEAKALKFRNASYSKQLKVIWKEWDW